MWWQMTLGKRENKKIKMKETQTETAQDDHAWTNPLPKILGIQFLL